MIGLILTLSFIFTTCSSEKVLEYGIKPLNTEPVPEIHYSGYSKILFDNSLKSFKDRKWEKAAEGFEKIVRNGEDPWKRRSIFMLARTYLELGKREEARDLFLRAIPEYEELADYSLYYISESFLEEKDYEKATEILRLLYKTYKESPLKGLSQFREAETFYISGKYSEAIKAFEDFLSENPKDPLVSEAKLYKGKSLKRTGLMEEADYIFKRLWIDDPAITDKVMEELAITKLTAEDYLLRAENLLKVSLYRNALIDLQKALELEKNPQKVNEIKLKIGITLFKAKRYEEAIEVLSKFLQVSKEALYYISKAYLRKGKKEKFLETSNKLYRLYPEDKKTSELLLIVADELRRSGDREKALSIYNLIIREYPEISDDALYQKGWMEYLSGNFEKSSSDMRSLREHHPESPRIPQALYWEARSYDRLGEKAKADSLYRRIVKEYPSTFYGYLAIERLNGKEIFMKIVEASLPRMSGRIPDPEIPFPKMRELNILGMKDEAIKELDYLRERYLGMIRTAHNPEDLETLIKIGEAYISLGEYRKAISMAEGYSKKEKRFDYLSYPLGFWPFLNKYSNDIMVDPYLLAALIREESRFDPKAISKAGAKGLMQIIPSTWDWISKEIKNQKSEIKDQNSKLQTMSSQSVSRNSNSELRNTDPFDPKENIARGSWYLRYLLDRFNMNLIIALSAYNAGPEVVSSWMKNGPEEMDEFIEEIPYSETKAYIKRVLRSYGRYKKIYTNSDKDL